MYAVIRAGGKQYRVAPGDVIRVEKTAAENGRVEFTDVLAVSSGEGQIGRPGSGRVVGQVVEEGRGDKVLVFHFKRKKQFKRLRGHRQPFTAVRITEISFDGQKFTAPEQAGKPKKEQAARPEVGPEMAAGEESAEAAAERKPGTRKHAPAAKAAGAKKHPAAKGGTGKKAHAPSAAKKSEKHKKK